MTERATDDKPAAEDEDVPRKTPLFLFYTCRTSGSSFLKHKLLDIAVHCWPYDDRAPVFYRRINHADKEKGQGKTRRGQTSKSHDSDSTGNSNSRESAAVGVIEELLQWIDSTVEKASSALGLTLYPVLIAHWGETFQFLFLFRMLEKYGISATETLGAHGVHFADPVPVLKQYKEARHPWLVESRSLGLGSLLNDWFPAQFDEAGLTFSRSCGALVLKLYTQSPLYWLLYRVPIYSTQEWIEFYEGEKLYQEDKWELQENIPASIVGMQRKMTVRQLLKHGYNWWSLINLFKSCGSPQHFRQELRDMDMKTGAAGRITATIGAMKLEQDGSREYKVRIKSHMPFAKYYHLTDARGRHFILRVANVLPPCFFSLADLCDNRWQVPDNLLQIGPPETWDAMLSRDANNVIGKSCDENGNKTQGFEEADVFGWRSCESQPSAVAGVKDVQSEDSSEPEWDKAEDCDLQLCDNGDLPDCYFKEPGPAHVPTTLVKGAGGINPFIFPEQEWLAVDSTDHKPDFPEPDSLKDEKCSEKNVVSSSHFKTSKSAPASQTTSADLHCGTSANRETSRAWKSQGTNHPNCAMSRHSTAANQNSCKPAGSNSWSNKNDSPVPRHSASANQSSLSGRKAAKLYSTNQSNCTSCQKNSFTSRYSTSTNDRRSAVRSRDSIMSNQRASMEPRACPATNHSSQDGSLGLSSASPSKLSSDEFTRYHTQGAIPREKRHVPLNSQSRKKNSQSSPANQMAAKQKIHQSTAANHSSPSENRGPSSTSSSESSNDKVFSTRLSRDKTHVPPRFQSKKKNGGKKTRRES
ncbi:uncharacterized protein LOC119721449 [Patiria miniata]|uniref:Uncharacterized protein n=1 Tax=Patiria miniata TaxID=46514 RepID=A0A913Z6W1_PATMI|nr:uncharacterized protein LOC119721449 [Patiria miniata]XP_038047456.1 uncharacterized protein LOC119721449 [Patiria miniata]XP_038047457.1 uncharacterized protein LOC119721449 [Patiria miniata]XP_038047458.1 uncharacterized protein LOC119721449 [Patiria miniata]